MTLDQIIAAERQATRAINAVSGFVDNGPERDAMARAIAIMAEARHFAVCWEEHRALEESGQLDAIDARIAREQMTNRLASFLTPNRF